jgi:hypothetical protein
MDFYSDAPGNISAAVDWHRFKHDCSLFLQLATGIEFMYGAFKTSLLNAPGCVCSDVKGSASGGKLAQAEPG